MAPRNPIQVLKEAKQIARDNGCFVYEKNGKYLVYRVGPAYNIYLGSRGKPETLCAFVCKVTNFK